MSQRINTTEARQLTALALPTILSQLAQAGLGVIDTIMAGHHSAQALAAIAIGTNIFNPVIVFIIGIMLVINPMSAQKNGEKDWDGLRELFHNGLFLALLLVIPSFILLRNAESLLHFIGAEASVIPLATDYINALSWGLPGLYLFFALRFTNEGLFANKVVMYVAISTLPLNVLFNYWFIYGGLGLAPMGAEGVGWATFWVYIYMFAVLLIYTAKSSRYRHINFFAKWHKPNIKTLSETLRVGIPMGMSLGLEIALFAAVGLLISGYSIAEIGGHQVAISVSSVGYMIPLGLSIAITARVGYHIGRGRPDLAKSAGYIGISMTVLFALMSVMILIIFPEAIANLYSEDKAVIAVTVQLLFFAALFQFSDGIQVASIGALRGLKDTKIPLYISAFAYWVIGFPLGYYFAEVLDYGVEGYWVALVSGLSVAAILMAIRFVKLIIHKNDLYQKEQKST